MAISIDTAAERAQAYIYGNLLVLAALATIGADSLEPVKSVFLVAGTVVSTFVAHVVAEAYGKRMRLGRRPDAHTIRESLRDSLPIVASGIVPCLVLALSAFQVLDPLLAFVLAAAWIVGRFLLLGFTIGRMRGEPSSWRTFGTGIALAVVGILVAVFKFAVTH